MPKSTSPAGPGATRRRALAARLVFTGPGLAYITAFMSLPVILLVVVSFMQRGRFGGVRWQPTLENYSRAVEPLYLGVLGNSMLIAAGATFIALLLGYPTAYAIARLPGRWRTIALILVVLPFWTNFLIRTYAWIILLNSEGPINAALIDLHIASAPIGLLYTPGAVVAGLVYAYLPLMVLPIYAAVERQDAQLVEAATNLGSSRTRAFWDITLPLTLPGVMIGCIFVFVPSLGNFVVPELLGGGKTVMVGNLIRDQFLEARDWPFGAVLTLVVIVMLVALFTFQARVSRRIRGDGLA